MIQFYPHCRKCIVCVKVEPSQSPTHTNSLLFIHQVNQKDVQRGKDNNNNKQGKAVGRRRKSSEEQKSEPNATTKFLFV
ncbi:unnamed protein product [Gadus morhua 'NCC']